MKRNLLFVVLVFALALASCKTATPVATAEVGATAAPVCEKPIKIGMIAAMTGTNAILGDYMKKGVTLAMEAKNAAGGIKGCPLELVIYDDEADPTKSVGLAQKVATEDNVVACWATTNSSSALADIPIFQQYKIPQFTNGTNVTITQKGSAYIFRVCPAGPAYEKPLVDYLVGKGFTKFAIIGDNTAYGKGEAQYQTDALKAHNLTPLVYEQHGIDDKDFTGQLTKIMAANPEVLLLADSEVAGGLLVKQARQLGFEGVMGGGSAMASLKFVETAGDAGEGVYFTTPYPGNDYNDATKAFAAAYQAAYGQAPELHGANVYDGMNMLMMAIEKADPLTPENVAAEMHKICGYKGLLGEFCYDEAGEGLKSCSLGQITNGELKIIQ